MLYYLLLTVGHLFPLCRIMLQVRRRLRKRFNGRLRAIADEQIEAAAWRRRWEVQLQHGGTYEQLRVETFLAFVAVIFSLRFFDTAFAFANS